jgi:hypothetical protein
MPPANDQAPERRPPRRSVTVAWALSPAFVLLPCVVIFGRQWPYLGWLAFFAGVLNMYAWSAVMLWTRRIEHWEVRAVPLTLLMIVINLAILIAGEALLVAAGGVGAGTSSAHP